MFINNWYVACIAAELGTAPKQLKMLGQNFVLFRASDSSIHCLSDLCCHRGASLAMGECKNDGIICPQHGWDCHQIIKPDSGDPGPEPAHVA